MGGRSSEGWGAPRDTVDVLVTDDALPEDARGVLRSDVGRIVFAHPEGAAP